MTECERIIKKGIIPASFLEEEVRDDFIVTTERKKIWTIELDLLFEVLKICNKHDINYFFCGGNLLGAVRHKGFIPWDDDVDIMMFREDYDRFCTICQSELEEPYFFQTTLTEKDCWCNTARVCNSNTTGIRKPMRGMKNVNKGIFIDILPLDTVSDNSFIRFFSYKNVRLRTIIANAYSFNINRNPLTRFINWFLHLPIISFDIKNWYIKLNKQASMTSWDKAKKIGFVMWPPYKLEKVTWDIKDFEGIVKLPFEFFEIEAPLGYKNILKVMYGDYMKFPPVEQRGIWHEIIFDPDMPYEDFYLKNGV